MLRDYLVLAITGSEATVSAYRRPLGYVQLTTTGTAAKLTLPAMPAASGLVIGYAVIQCIGAAGTDYVAWRDDGTAPTTTIGMRIFSGQELDYTGDLTMIQFITGSGSPVLNVSFYA